MAERPWGIDVSHHQGKVDYKRVKAAGASFVFHKATEGERSTDSQFKDAWPRIFWAGIKVRGAYHYAHIDNDPVLEALHFVETVERAGGFHKGDFAILDIEDVCDASKRIGNITAAKWARTWLDTVLVMTGLPKRRVLVYTGSWWWGPRTGNSDIAVDHPLWLAAYTSEPRLNYRPWRIWRFWQHTSSAHVDGVQGKVDRNVFNGSAFALWRMSRRRR